MVPLRICLLAVATIVPATAMVQKETGSVAAHVVFPGGSLVGRNERHEIMRRERTLAAGEGDEIERPQLLGPPIALVMESNPTFVPVQNAAVSVPIEQRFAQTLPAATAQSMPTPVQFAAAGSAVAAPAVVAPAAVAPVAAAPVTPLPGPVIAPAKAATPPPVAASTPPTQHYTSSESSSSSSSSNIVNGVPQPAAPAKVAPAVAAWTPAKAAAAKAAPAAPATAAGVATVSPATAAPAAPAKVAAKKAAPPAAAAIPSAPGAVVSGVVKAVTNSTSPDITLGPQKKSSVMSVLIFGLSVTAALFTSGFVACLLQGRQQEKHQPVENSPSERTPTSRDAGIPGMSASLHERSIMLDSGKSASGRPADSRRHLASPERRPHEESCW